jgi:hypothetical protein
MTVPFPEPTMPIASRAEVFLTYLDYFRSRLVSKLASMPAAELRSSRLPSGWTPLELIKHLRQVELRWLEWGFASEMSAIRGQTSVTVTGTWRQRKRWPS